MLLFSPLQEEIQDTRQRLEGEIQALRTALEASESMADTLSPRELRGTLVNPQDMKTAHVEQMNAKNEEIEKLQRQLYETADQIEKVGDNRDNTGNTATQKGNLDYIREVIDYM